MACRLPVALACAAVTFAAAALGAQTPIAPGARIRVTIATERPSVSVGTFVGVQRDTLAYRLPGTALPRLVPLERVSEIDVSTGLHRHVLSGALIGGGAGAAAGAVIGSQSGRSVTPCWFNPCGRSERALAGGIAGGGIGAILGAIAGYEAMRDSWQGVLPETLRGRVAISGTGSLRRPTGVKIRIAF